MTSTFLSLLSVVAQTDAITIPTMWLVGIGVWMTAAIGAMGGFIAMIFRKNLEQQESDRKLFREALEKFSERDRRFDELLKVIERQNADVIKVVSEATRRA